MRDWIHGVEDGSDASVLTTITNKSVNAAKRELNDVMDLAESSLMFGLTVYVQEIQLSHRK